MRHRFRAVPLSLAVALACATPQRTPTSLPPLAETASELPPSLPDAGADMHLDLVAKMLDAGSYYAALAHLEAVPEKALSPRAKWLQAEALRRTGELERASDLYWSIAKGDHAGLAYRGLGLIAAQSGDLRSAVELLERARRLLPTDVRVRNDLGYALVLAGRDAQARVHFATAVELDAKDSRSAMNLLLVLHLQREEGPLRAFAARRGISEAALAEVRQEAEELRTARAGEAATLPPVLAAPPLAGTQARDPAPRSAGGKGRAPLER